MIWNTNLHAELETVKKQVNLLVDLWRIFRILTCKPRYRRKHAFVGFAAIIAFKTKKKIHKKAELRLLLELVDFTLMLTFRPCSPSVPSVSFNVVSAT